MRTSAEAEHAREQKKMNNPMFEDVTDDLNSVCIRLATDTVCAFACLRTCCSAATFVCDVAPTSHASSCCLPMLSVSLI
eukprot:COSAG02_NODE_92_length_37588_cov_135.916242_14_plen_79_part_00